MEIIAKKNLSGISTRAEAFAFCRQVLKTAFPVALWRLPKAAEHYILVDIRQSSQDQPIEDLNQCFIINPYEKNHPSEPMVLCGDIIIKLQEEHAEAYLSPAVSASDLDHFWETLDLSAQKPANPLQNGTCKDFQELVKNGIEKIKSGEAEKIVLSRYADYLLPDDFDALNVFEKLSATYPNAFCHLTNTAEYGLWLGASPEKMISIEQDRYFSTDALAGTQPLPEGTDLGQIAWTQKEIEEQAMVSRYIINCFKYIRLREFEEIGPKTVKAGNLAHLKTGFKVDMTATNSPLLGSIMLDLLHPTSAVCGHPRIVANDFISQNEGYNRELFAGFLGPVGFGGNTNLFVNLRCMKVHESTARLFAGAGITACSDPAREFSETQHKMQTLLRVLDL